jgi:hypothetical protein
MDMDTEQVQQHAQIREPRVLDGGESDDGESDSESDDGESDSDSDGFDSADEGELAKHQLVAARG